MKKVFSLLAVLALLCMTSSVWAAAVLPQGTKTAYAEFSSEDINITVDLYELPATYSTNFYQSGTPTSADQIEFEIDNNAFSFGSSTVYKAQGNVFAKIKTNLASVGDNKKLFMFTDNMNNSSDYKVFGNGNRKTQNWGTEQDKHYAQVCNGLVRKGGKATTNPGEETGNYCNDGDYAPIKMQFIKAVDADAEGQRYSKANYPDVFTGSADYKGLKDLLDASDTYEGNNLRDKMEIGKSGAGGGIWVGSNWYSGNDDVIVFFGASFDHVVGGDKYMTSTIKFEYAAE